MSYRLVLQPTDTPNFIALWDILESDIESFWIAPYQIEVGLDQIDVVFDDSTVPKRVKDLLFVYGIDAKCAQL